MIVCRQCGQQAREGEDFCQSCGAYLEWEGEKVEPTAPARPSAGPSGGGAPAPATGRGAAPAAPAGPSAPAGPPAGGPPPAAAPPGPWVDMPPDGAPAWTIGPASRDRAHAAPAPGPGPGGPGSSPWADVPQPPTPAGGPPTTPVRSAAAPASVMCLECGASNTGDRRFCRRCGSSLELVALTGRSDPAAPPAPPGPPAPGAPGAAVEGPVMPPAPPAPPVPGPGRAPGPAVPDAPRVMARGQAPAVPPTKGMQPAESSARPPPVRPPASTAPDVAPGGPTCAQCGTANPPGRRFCRRCGAVVAGMLPAEAAAPLPRGARPGWWSRLVAKLRRRDPEDERFTASGTARSAYRGALDVRYRIFRVLALVAGAGFLIGSLGFTGYNPLTGARSLWNKAFPRDKRVSELQANADPDQGINNDFPPSAAVDGDPKTAWAGQWTLTKDDAAAEGCTEDPTLGGADHALVVTMPAPSKLSKLRIQPSLPAGDPDRAGQWKPTKLELRFDDGSCKQLTLGDQAGFQEKRIKGPVTKHVRIAILDAAPPADRAKAQAGGNLVSIGELRLYRPR